MPNLIVVPSSVPVIPSQVAHFRVAEPAINQELVQWSVAGPADTDLGSIDAQGKYTAPKSVSGPFDVIVTARAGDAEGTATVKVSGMSREDTVGGTQISLDTISILPSSAVLGAKAGQRFEARDMSGQPVSASWSLLGTAGLGPESVGTLDATSGTYTAPNEVTADRYLTIVAVTATGATDKAFVLLTTGGVRIVPGEVTLRSKEKQVFSALVQGDPNNEVTWLTSPTTDADLAPVPSSSASIVYSAPKELQEDARVIVAAMSTATKAVGYANVTLLADPWVGRGPWRIGAWLLALAIVVPLLYLLWPPPSDRTRLREALAAQGTAQRLVEQREAGVNKLNLTTKALTAKLGGLPNTPETGQLRDDLLRQIETVDVSLAAANESLQEARRDGQAKAAAVAAEQEAFDQGVKDERLLFFLVLLAGGLGSFVHTTRSFVDFLGNRRLRPSWAWWYVLQPFTGAALAMVMYLVVRGGFLASAPGATALNPWGFVAVAALVGLFSKQATNKLDELFTTMFKTDKERELKDKLDTKR